MMNTILSPAQRVGRAATRACAGLVAFAALLTACADKGFTPPTATLSPVIALQITTTADQQAAFGANWILVAAGYDNPDATSGGNGNDGDNNDDVRLLGRVYRPLSAGTQRITLPVDISPCLAAWSGRGRSTCPLQVGAWIVSDTSYFPPGNLDDDNSEPEKSAFDFAFAAFDVGPGQSPTIPPIDLSASRFGVVKWAADNALQVGGERAPTGFSSAVTGIPSGAGVVLFATAQGFDFAAQVPGQPTPGPYPQLAILQNGSWSRVTATVIPLSQQGTNTNFTAVTAFSLSDVYMSHPTGLYRYDGGAIAKVAAISDSLFHVASVTTASGGKFVIAGSQSGNVWIGNTQTWQRYNLSTTQRIDQVCITGPTEAFAASSVGGGLWRFDGTAWVAVPASASIGKFALQCPGPGQAYVIALNTAFLKWSGSTWVIIPATGLPSSSLATWGIVSSTEMYATSDSSINHRVFYRGNGTSWTEVGRTRFTQLSAGVNRYLWADPRGGAAYYGSPFGRIEKVTPSGVSVVSYQPSTRDISMSSANSAFAVGWNMFLARWDGVKWNMDAPPANTPSVRILQGVWSDRSSNAWVVGNASTIFRYDGTSWSVVSDIARPIAGDDSYNAVWGVGSDVWIAGAATIVHCRSATNCSVEGSGGAGALYGVWGTSPTNVFAVGAGGRITRFNGTTWTPMASPTARTLVRVSGAGDDVWAVGDSALVHFDGTTWRNVAMIDDLSRTFGTSNVGTQGAFQLGLWVRNAKEVYVAGPFGDLVRFDGKEWRNMISSNFRRRVVGIAGLAGGCALALLDGLGDSPAPTLLRGIGPSGCFLSPMTPPTSWP